MKIVLTLLLAPLLCACALSSHAATGSATTGNVTVDTRSDNADLSALSLSSGTLDQTFASGTTSYTASVPDATTSLTVTPTRAEANATIEARVGANPFASVTSGSPSGALALNVGANTIKVRVTAQDTTTTKTYTITVTRAATTPTLTTATQSAVTATSATLGGNVTSDGGAAVTERGIVWATTASPTTANTKVTNGSGTGPFSTMVTGLPAVTTVFARAYATNEAGTAYGEEIAFTTGTTVEFDNGAASYDRSILPGGRQVFHFTLAGPRFVSFATLGDGALRAELFGSGGNLIASFTGETNFDLKQLLLAGNYALHVFREADAGPVQTFDLTIDASAVAATRPDPTSRWGPRPPAWWAGPSTGAPSRPISSRGKHGP